MNYALMNDARARAPKMARISGYKFIPSRFCSLTAVAFILGDGHAHPRYPDININISYYPPSRGWERHVITRAKSPLVNTIDVRHSEKNEREREREGTAERWHLKLISPINATRSRINAPTTKTFFRLLAPVWRLAALK